MLLVYGANCALDIVSSYCGGFPWYVYGYYSVCRYRVVMYA